jgi:hypothetical protein
MMAADGGWLPGLPHLVYRVWHSVMMQSSEIGRIILGCVGCDNPKAFA